MVAAFAVVLIGLTTSLVTRAQTAATTMLVCAVLGVGLSYFSVQNMRSELQQEIASAQNEQGATVDTPFLSGEQQEQLGRRMSGAVRVEEEEGYWLTLGSLLLAALFAVLTLFSVRREVAAPS